MKKTKILLLPILLILFVIIFTACGEDDDVQIGVSFMETNVYLDQIGDTHTMNFASEIDTTRISWETSNPAVAVCENGVITATGWGICLIRATLGTNDTAACMVTVNDDNPEINLSIIDHEFGTLGESVSISASNKYGHDISELLYWSSSNISVATVKDGVIKAINYGTCLITATAKNGNSAVCIVETRDPALPTIDFEEIGRDEIIKLDNVGDELRLTADIFNDTADNIKWISSDERVVTCVGGRITAVSKGTAVVIAVTDSGATAARMVEVEGGVEHEIPEEGRAIFDFAVKNLGKTIKFVDMNTDAVVASFIITGVRIEGYIYDDNGVFYLTPYFTCVKVYDKDGLDGTASFDAQLKLYNEYNELCEYYRCRYVGMKVGDTMEVSTAMFGVADKNYVRKFNFVLVPVIES